MNESLAHLLFSVREQREMYEEYQQRGSPKWITGAELGDIAYLFEAAEPYVVPSLTRTVEFYAKLDVSRRRMPLERVVRDLRRLHRELTWSYRTGGGMGGQPTFSPLDLELPREWRGGIV